MGKAKSSYYYKSCLQICLALPCIAADCHPRPFLRMVIDSCADFMKSLANYTPNALPAAELRPQDRWHLRAPGGGVLPGQGRDPPGAQAFAPKADEAQARQRGRCTPSASATGSRGSLWPLPISLRPLLLHVLRMTPKCHWIRVCIHVSEKLGASNLWARTPRAASRSRSSA